MKHNDISSHRPLVERLLHLLQAVRDTHDASAQAELNALLRENTDARLFMARLLVDEQALISRLRDENITALLEPPSAAQPPLRIASRWRAWRPLAAAAAGIVIGICGTSILFAFSPVKKIYKFLNVSTFISGGFESGPTMIPRGFPRSMGAWSGDDAEVVTSATKKPSEGGRMLRFNKACPEPNVIGRGALACDLYQIVDLRALREKIPPNGGAALRLSADFLDARLEAGPEMRFACSITLFAGSPEDIQAVWPAVLDRILGSGYAELVSCGGPGAHEWRKLRTFCMLSQEADYAVVRIKCHGPKGSGEPAVFGQQFADNMVLHLRTQSSSQED